MREELRRKSFLFLDGLSKVYGPRVILADIELAVGPNEIVTLVGSSGCGKSTLLRLILGQELPTAGAIFLDGEPVGVTDPSRGIVTRQYSLFPHLTLLGNVLLGPKLRHGLFGWRTNKADLSAEAFFYLEKLGLGEWADSYPHELSTALRQRAALAQSLIMRPKVLLLDDPFADLDPGTRENMQILLLELWEEFKLTIFFVTSDLEEAVFLGTRILALSQYYSDERAPDSALARGSRIVFDRALPKQGLPTLVKGTEKFGELVRQLRQDGFAPEYLQHAKDFNLRHPHSLQTLRGGDGNGC